MARDYKQNQAIRSGVLGAARAHFYFAMILAVSTIIFDAWDVITPDRVMQHWTLLSMLVIVTGLVWYAARDNVKNQGFYKILLGALILVDIIIAGFLVYIDRGMASRNVLLFAIPIVTSGLLASRRALFGTAAISAAVYSLAAIRYFVDNFNEGYKAELYGILAFYGVVLFVIAGSVLVIMSQNKHVD